MFLYWTANSDFPPSFQPFYFLCQNKLPANVKRLHSARSFEIFLETFCVVYSHNRSFTLWGFVWHLHKNTWFLTCLLFTKQFIWARAQRHCHISISWCPFLCLLEMRLSANFSSGKCLEMKYFGFASALFVQIFFFFFRSISTNQNYM